MARLNQNIVIPDNTRLEKLSEFSDSEITSIQFGQSVKICGNYIFARSHYIRELVIPSGTNMSGYGIFYHSNQLQILNVGDNVRFSGNYIFQECINLESLSIGHSTIISGNQCFSGLRSLQRLQFAPNTTFSGYFLFAECENIQEVIIPDNCTISGDFFFRKCSRLERIVIGNNVVIRGRECFSECTGIRRVTIGDNVTISGVRFMEGCFRNQNVELTIGSGYMGDPIHIPMPILHIRKFADIKSGLRFEMDKCMISFEEFEDDSDVIVLQCGHVFLLEPFQKWIAIQIFCPSCRNRI